MSKYKKEFRFRGKQILMLGLVALVITAGYYRWTIEQEKLSESVSVAGDAVPVNADNAGEDNAGENKEGESGEGAAEISKLKQDRDAARSQSVEEWKKIAQNTEASAETKKEAEKKITAAAENADKERKIETMVKAKGFEDCFAYVDGGNAAVTVKGGEIDGAKVAQIKDIVVTETGVSVKNIKINAI